MFCHIQAQKKILTCRKEDRAYKLILSSLWQFCCDCFNLVVCTVRGFRLQGPAEPYPLCPMRASIVLRLPSELLQSFTNVPQPFEKCLLTESFSLDIPLPAFYPASVLLSPPFSCSNLSCQLPRFVFGSDLSLSIRQSHSMFTSPKGPSQPSH